MESKKTEHLNHLLNLTINNKASDLHLLAGYQPTLRVNGELYPIAGEAILGEDGVRDLIMLLLKERKDRFLREKELDFSYSFKGGEFRVNVYHQQGLPAASLRFIRAKIESLSELNLPETLKIVTEWQQGFVLVTGPTGHGKSTTVAALLEEINRSRRAHIITVEDPIEYRIKPVKAIISQREIEIDTLNWSRALRSCLREDPDVVFIGEMRDLETIQAALTIAETGHLVFSTLHTNSAAETIDRIIDVFPSGAREQVRAQFANALGMVISQRLIPSDNSGRIPAIEILTSTAAVKTAIREGKTHMIDNIIQTSGELGMCLLENSLASLVRQGKISPERAKAFAIRRTELIRMLRQKQ